MATTSGFPGFSFAPGAAEELGRGIVRGGVGAAKEALHGVPLDQLAGKIGDIFGKTAGSGLRTGISGAGSGAADGLVDVIQHLSKRVSFIR